MSFKPMHCNGAESSLEFINHEITWKKKSAKCSKGRCFDEPYVHAPIDKFGVPGRWLRHKLLDGILVGTPVILTIQKHRTPSRTTLMKFLSFLGTEDFYTILFLSFCWLFDPRLGRLFGALMWVGFYTTGFLKTLFCLPRPPCPPVVPLEKAFDWALPSHHSLLGVILPWYIWLYINLHYELSPFAMGIICSLIILWSFGVLLSRLYLGVHSPADIVCGGVVGVFVLCVWIQIDDYVDFIMSQQNIEAQLQLLIFVTILLCLHPITEPGNPSFLDTCILHGVLSGIILGRAQRSRMFGIPALWETMQDDWSLVRFFQLSLLRFAIGAIVITVLRITLKLIFTVVFEHVYRLVGLPSFNSSTYRKKMPANPKHYNKHFKLPPIYEIEKKAIESDDDVTSEDGDSPSDDVIAMASRNWFNFIQICNAVSSVVTRKDDEAWDVMVPVKLITYTIISYAAVELIPQLFLLLAI